MSEQEEKLQCLWGGGLTFDYERSLQIHQDRMSDLVDLDRKIGEIPEAKDREFAVSLIQQFAENHTLSVKQWGWVGKLLTSVQNLQPLYGDFRAVGVMFMLAGEHLKVPKIRLISPEGRYVQLNFLIEEGIIKVFVDGWQGHGYRKYAGRITSLGEQAQIYPYGQDRMTDDVQTCLHNFAMNPEQVAKASAEKLGCCSFCGQRLSDPESKRRGYGATCASHFGLPWGEGVVKFTPSRINNNTDLESLFN